MIWQILFPSAIQTSRYTWDKGLVTKTSKFAVLGLFVISGAFVIYQQRSVLAATGQTIITQRGYIWENDNEDQASGDSVDENAPLAAANTPLTNVRKGERLTLRAQIDNTGSGTFNASDELALFYDRNDGIWSKVKLSTTAEVGTGSGCVGTVWTCVTLESTDDVGDYNFVAINPVSGLPWIAYEKGTGSELKLARYVGSGGTGCDLPEWTCEVVEETGSSGREAKIAFDQTGKAWMAHLDASNNDIQIAEYVGGGSGTGCDSADWTCYKIAVTNAYEHIALNIDSSGTPWVAFSDSTVDDLIVAEFVSSGGDCDTTHGGSDAWECTAIHTSGVYNAKDISFSATGNPIIATNESGSDDLLVAEYVVSGGSGCADSAWTCTVVWGTLGSSGRGPSIAHAPNGSAWISHYTTNDILLVSNYVGTGGDCDDSYSGSDAWDCAEVDAIGVFSGNPTTSLVFAPDGTAWISYTDDDSSNDLRLARYVGSDGTGCSETTTYDCIDIATSGAVGEDSSIAFDSRGKPWISYSDVTSGEDLKLAYIDRGGEITISPGISGSNGDALSESHADMTSPTDTTNRDDADCIGTGGTPAFSAGEWFETENGTGTSLAAGSTNLQCTEVAWTLDTSQAVEGTTYRFVIASDDAFAPSRTPWRGPSSVVEYPTLTIESETTARYAKGVNPKLSDCTGNVNWGCEVIAKDGVGLGRYPTISFDSDGTAWVGAFNDTTDGFMVANYVGSGGDCDTLWTSGSDSWECRMVYDDTGQDGAYSASAIDPKTGRPSFVFVEDALGTGTSHVIHAEYVGSGGSGCVGGSAEFNCTAIMEDPNSGSFGEDLDIEYTSAGIAYVYMHQSSGRDMWFAEYVGSGGNCDDYNGSDAWKCSEINTTGGGGQTASMVIDHNDIPWIASYNEDSDTLHIARYVGAGGSCTDTAWDCTDVDGGTGSIAVGSVGITVDQNNVIWASYSEDSTLDDEDLYVARFVGGGAGSGCDDSDWTCTLVDDPPAGAEDLFGEETSIGTDSTGAPVIVYKVSGVTGVFNEVRTARYVGSGGSGCDSSEWDGCGVVYAKNGAGRDIEIGFDQNGTIWYVHRDETTDDLRVAKQHNPSVPLSGEVVNAANNSGVAGTGDAMYRLDDGRTPRTDPISACASTTLTSEGYCGVSALDGQYDTIEAGLYERAILTFAQKFDVNTSTPSLVWQGETNRAPSTSGTNSDLVLEVYRGGSVDAWEEIGRNSSSTNCDGTTCTVGGSAFGTTADYYEADGADYWSYFRVYQEANGTSATTLKTDFVQVGGPAQINQVGYIWENDDTESSSTVLTQQGSPVKIDDASNFTPSVGDAARQIVRAANGTLYATVYHANSCEVWKSADGSSWTKQGADLGCAQQGTVSASVVSAIDSSGVIHIAHYQNAFSFPNYIKAISYSTFNTNTDSFTLSNQLVTSWSTTESKDIFHLYDIAVDSNNAPHILYDQDFFSGSDVLRYRNRVTGSWQTQRTVEAVPNTHGSITINEDNIPEIAYINNTDGDLTAAVGNLNNASSFTLHDVDTDVGSFGATIGIDDAGNTWIAYVDETGATDYLAIAKHDDASAWTTGWTTAGSTIYAVGPSMYIRGSDVYIFFQQGATQDIAYDVYSDDASSWAGEVVIETGTYNNAAVNWANYNLNDDGRIDYLFYDGTDAYWNALIDVPVAGSSNTQLAAGNTPLDYVRKGTRLNLRTQIENTGGAASGVPQLFYDTDGDGDWRPVNSSAVTSTGTGSGCDSSAWTCSVVHDDAGGSWHSSGVAIDPDSGYPILSMLEQSAGDHYIGRYVKTGGSGCGGSSTEWSCEVMATHYPGAFGIDVSEKGTIWAASADYDISINKYVGAGGSGCTGASTRWNCLDISDHTAHTDGTEVAVGKNDDPWIAFGRADSFDNLMVAHYVGSGGTGCDFSVTSYSCVTVDATGNVGQELDIVVDHNNVPWIIYFDITNNEYKVAHYVGSSGNCDSTGGSDAWQCDIVSDDRWGGARPRIDVAPDGTVWTAFIDGNGAGANGNVWMAHYVGSGGDCDSDISGASDAWQCEEVVSDANNYDRVDLTFLPDGSPAIAFRHSGDYAIRYARYVGSGGSGCTTAAWTGCGVIEDHGSIQYGDYLSIVTDAFGTPWIFTTDSNADVISIRLESSAGGEITLAASPQPMSAQIDESHADMVSISDSAGRADADCLTAGAVWNAGAYVGLSETAVVLPAGYQNPQCSEYVWTIDTSQASIDTTYRFIVSYGIPGATKSTPTLGPSTTDEYPTIVVKADKDSRISKGASSAYANCDNTAWGCKIIDETTAGENPSIAVGEDGDIWVSYRIDGAADNLGVAHYVGSGGTGCASGVTDWECWVVDTTGYTGKHSDVAINNEGEVYVSYQYNATTENGDTGGTLKIAQYVGSGGSGCASSSWTCTAIDNTGTAGRWSSLAFSPVGVPYIAYNDGGNVTVAQYVGQAGNCDGSTAWSCVPLEDNVASTNNSGVGTDIGFNERGELYVVWGDFATASVDIAQYVGAGGNCDATAAWQCTIIADMDAATQSLQEPSLSFDADGDPWVTFHDQGPGDLLAAQYVGSGGDCDTAGYLGGGSDAWECYQVDVTNTVGRSPAIAFDSQGVATIAYQFDTDKDLRTARFVGSGGSCNDAAWDGCSAIDSTNTVGENIDTAFDANGSQWIVYMENSGSDLRVAKQHMSRNRLSADRLTFGSRSAGTGDAQYRLDPGEHPVGTSICPSSSAFSGYCGTRNPDGAYDSIRTLAGQRPIYTYAMRVSTNTQAPTIEWTGRTDTAPNSAGTAGDLHLEIFRFGSTNAWETLATNTTSSNCDTVDCSLSGMPTGTLGEYFESDSGEYWVHIRVYQVQGSSSINFRLDSFDSYITGGQLRGGQRFEDEVRTPFR